MNAYTIETYNNRPPFNYFYKSIKNILEKKDQLIVGWSIENDVRYVFDACKRYNLNQIKYEYIDLQKIIMKIEGLDNPPSLESACEKYNIQTMISHKSDDDAYLTMEIAKHICKTLNMTLEQLYEKYNEFVSDVDKFTTSLLTDEQLKTRLNRRKMAMLINSSHPKNKYQNEFINCDDVYVFSVKVIDKHSTNLKEIIKHIYNCGAQCTTNFKEANVIVSDTKSLRQYKQHYENEIVKVITYKQLKESTGLFAKNR